MFADSFSKSLVTELRSGKTEQMEPFRQVILAVQGKQRWEDLPAGQIAGRSHNH
jgi:hypothetical protein